MAIDVGEGLRGIQPVKEVLSNGSDNHYRERFYEYFEESLKKSENKGKAINGEEIMKQIKYSYDSLYCKTGVQPNAVLLSQDYMAAIETDCEVAVTISTMKAPLSRVFGLTIVLTKGEKIVKACIMEE